MKNLLLLSIIFFAINSHAQLLPVTSSVFHWDSLTVTKNGQRESRKIAEGTTAEFEYFEIHATTQLKGATPKPAHTQTDIEELIIIKEGTMRCTVGEKTAILSTGSVILIPPLQLQTIENIGNGPLTYYVLMFRSKKQMSIERSKKAGGALLLNHDSLPYKETDNKGNRKYFDQPTATCENFEMHITYLKVKGPSHAPHQHADTEIILMIDGETEMMIDEKLYKATAGDLYIVESGKLHGISNAADKPCSYFAFKWR